MENFNLASPWVIYYNELKTMFESDEEVNVKMECINDGNYVIKLFVEDNNKADALFKILDREKNFGNVTVNIEVIPANPVSSMGVSELFEVAFNGNCALYDIVEHETPLGTFNYVVFDKEVVQYHNDDISDLHGVKSTLYQEIAKDIFDKNLSVYYCTSVDDEEGDY